MPLLEVRDLVKTFTLPRSRDLLWAVNHVDLAVEPGEVVGLVGESGSGKTTLGRCVLRLVEPTSGSIRFDGRDLIGLSGREMRLLRRRMQIVFQDPYGSLNPAMTARSIVAEPLVVFGRPSRAELRRRVGEAAERVGLSDEHLASYPHQLSGGEQQRVGIARALVLEPSFVVLDEPTSALDPTVRPDILDLLRRLKDELELAYLFISHDLTVVRHISDRVAVMYLGKIVEHGPTADIFERPLHPYTRSLMSSAL